MKVLVLGTMLLAGCATTGSQEMSAEQLKAIASDKNVSAVCSTIIGPWGTGKFVFVNIDKSVVTNGNVSVDANCLVTMSQIRIVPTATVVPTVMPPVPPATK